MKFFCHIFFFLFLAANSYSQSSFKKLSRPEKCWALCHPFKAKKAAKITREVQKVVDSVKRTGIIGSDNNGGSLDAFKHAYWMASVATVIGRKQALKLGVAHEKGNYIQYKKQEMEDAAMPDSISSVMDLKNNEFGVSSVTKSKNLSQEIIQKKIMDGLATGKLTVIKKDEFGNFLTCDGAVIYLKEWKGRWGNPKCLIPLVYH